MAEELDDGEFWLPSQFLTEEDILTDFDISTPTTGSTNGFNSDLTSPLDSVTETESDEEELLAELTRQMALSPFLPGCGTAKPKGWALSGSPQSTLCSLGVIGGGGDGSGHGSPTGRLSPPPAPANVDYLKVRESASFDLLNAAAGEVAKIRMLAEQPQKGTGYFDSNRALLCNQRKPANPSSLPPLKVNHTNPNFHGYVPRQSDLSHQQLQAFQFQQLWNQESMKQQGKDGLWGHVKPIGQFISSNNQHRHQHHQQNRTLGLSPSAWPPLQHNRQLHPPAPATNLPGSGMRTTMFLGPSLSKRESVGTGVFLPRSVNPTVPRKSNNKAESNGRIRGQNNGSHGPKRKSDNARSQAAVNSEIQLPSEWTY